MIKTMVVVCDGCGAETFTNGTKLPEGWRTVRWVPGILSRPGMPEHRPGRHDFCTPACLDKVFPVEKEEDPKNDEEYT